MAATLPLEYAAIAIVKAATFILFPIDAYGEFLSQFSFLTLGQVGYLSLLDRQ